MQMKKELQALRTQIQNLTAELQRMKDGGQTLSNEFQAAQALRKSLIARLYQVKR